MQLQIIAYMPGKPDGITIHDNIVAVRVKKRNNGRNGFGRFLGIGAGVKKTGSQ